MLYESLFDILILANFSQNFWKPGSAFSDSAKKKSRDGSMYREKLSSTSARLEQEKNDPSEVTDSSLSNSGTSSWKGCHADS